MKRCLLILLFLFTAPALLTAAPQVPVRKQKNANRISASERLRDYFSRINVTNLNEKDRSNDADDDYVYMGSPGFNKPCLLREKHIAPGSRGAFISFEMELNDPEEGGYGVLFFEKGELRYPLYNDKRFHVYNWETAAPDGRNLGKLYGIAFTANSQRIKLRRFSFRGPVQGDADVLLLNAGPPYLLADENGKAMLSFYLYNTGGTLTQKLKLSQFHLPSGVKIGAAARNELPGIRPNQRFLYQIEADVTRAQDGRLQFKYSGKDISLQSFRGDLYSYLRSPLPADSIKPLPTIIPVGAFFHTAPVKWQEFRKNAPLFRPVYGDYFPGDPKFVAWQTRHLAENGISFLFADWYWNGGQRAHTEWENAFRNSDAAGEKVLSYAPVWRDFSDSISDEEFLAAIQSLIENHFNQDYAFRIDEKPVLVLPLLTGRNLKHLFDRAGEMAVEAGLSGIRLIALVTPEQLDNKGFLQEGVKGGFNLIVCENPIRPDKKPDDAGRTDYSAVAAGSRKLWNDIRKLPDLQLIPTLSSGHDETPLLGISAGFITNRNKDTFQKHCKEALSFGERQPVKLVLAGPLNDWRNGAFLEPDEFHGFDFYEAIRETFGARGEPKKAPENLFPLMK